MTTCRRPRDRECASGRSELPSGISARKTKHREAVGTAMSGVGGLWGSGRPRPVAARSRPMVQEASTQRAGGCDGGASPGACVSSGSTEPCERFEGCSAPFPLESGGYPCPFSITPIGHFEVSCATYYEHRRGVPSARVLSDQEPVEKIMGIHPESKGAYGSPRTHTRCVDRKWTADGAE